MSTDTDRLAEIRAKFSAFHWRHTDARFLLRLIDERDAAAADLRAWGYALERELVATQVERDHLLNAAQRRAQAARQAALNELLAWHSDKMDASVDLAALDAEHHWRCTAHSESNDHIRSIMAPKGEGEELWRHRERGTTYEIVGTVRVQCPLDAPMQDDEQPLLYRDVNSGHWGARREAEFHDGRFEKIAPQGNTDTGGET